ncbi:MAG: TIM barrel protein [Chloroflexi bacterium]|nr:TIM barrel protein [Chloroflexota bacterium]
MPQLLFGPAGIPRSTQGKSTVDGIARVHEVGLDCMEVQFVQRVAMGPAAAKQVQEAARQNNVRLSAHAPYAINLNSHEPDKLAASEQRLLLAARVGHLCGAETVNAHLAFYLGDPPAEVYQRVKTALARVVKTLREESNPIIVRPEVMGKGSQFGAIEEVLDLSAEIDGVLPTIDFSHWHARTGRYNSYAEFTEVLKQIEAKLGRRGIENMHMHISGIKYSKAGELSHLNFAEADLRYEELMRALKDTGAGGMAICESPNLEEDALVLQETYRKLNS